MKDTQIIKDCKNCKFGSDICIKPCFDQSYWQPKLIQIIPQITSIKPETSIDMLMKGHKLYDKTDTGKRTDFGTGAIRETNDGRGRYDLIGTEGLRRLALRYEFGAMKYGDRNWQAGLPTSNCLNSMIRHTIEYMMGMDDEDHLAAIAWNAFAIMEFEKTHPELQNIPTRRK